MFFLAKSKSPQLIRAEAIFCVWRILPPLSLSSVLLNAPTMVKIELGALLVEDQHLTLIYFLGS